MGEHIAGELAHELELREQAGLRRELEGARPGPVDFSSNDYLGLASDPRLAEAAAQAARDHGAGGRASRLLGGGSPLHRACEHEMAAWLGAEDALLFPSGYQANAGLLTSLLQRGDVVFSDRLNHASLIDGARLSRARIQIHGHGDLDELARQLEGSRSARRRIVLTEGVFSMDGDRSALVELDELCRRFDAGLIVDEAHSVGLLGPEGAGAWAEAGIEGETSLLARVVTGGKSLGVGGAFVVGSKVLCELLVNRARSFIFTTAPPPALAGALLASIPIVRAAETKRRAVMERCARLAARLDLSPPAGAIVPFVLGSNEAALEAAAQLAKQGLDVRAVRPPSVPAGGARLRIVVHAANTDAECDELARHLGGMERAPLTPAAVRGRRGLFVVGTDTGIGKTVVSALLLKAARRLGPAAYWKPVQTGDDSDTNTVGELAEARPHELLRPAWELALPASPHEAAAAEEREIDPAQIAKGLVGLERTLEDSRLIVELAGGLLVPYRLDATQGDWLEEIGAQCILVARSGLGTLNHTLLTLEALRARHVEPRALFLVGDPHLSNRSTLAQLSRLAHVFEVPRFDPLEPKALDDWLDGHDLSMVFDP